MDVVFGIVVVAYSGRALLTWVGASRRVQKTTFTTNGTKTSPDGSKITVEHKIVNDLNEYDCER